MDIIAKHQIGTPKRSTLLNGIKLSGEGNIKNKGGNYYSNRVSTIMVTLKKELNKKKFNYNLPKVIISDRPIKNQDVFYNKETGILFVSKRILKSAQTELLVMLFLYGIANHFYDTNKIKLPNLRYVHDYVRKNRHFFKEYMNGIYLYIPNYKYGEGICLPKININNFQDFVIKNFSFYVQDLYPDDIEGELERMITAVQMSFSR